MMNFKPTAAALVIFLTSAIAPLSANDVKTQLDAQQRSMLELQNQIDALSGELAAARGEIELLLNRVNQLEKAQVQSASVKTESKEQAVSESKRTEIKSPTGSETAKTDDPIRKAYDEAYADVQSNQLKRAEQRFDDFVKKNPSHALTPNAWYWLGQIQFKQGKPQEARVSFLNAASYEQSAKRPDALYKLGLISEQLGDADKAQRYYQVLIKTYPEDTSAKLAQKLLKKPQ